MIESPIHIAYVLNFRVAPSYSIKRNCFIEGVPAFPTTIGENAFIGPDVHIHAATHPMDRREKEGRNGPTLAGPVTIGNDSLSGMVMYAVHRVSAQYRTNRQPSQGAPLATVV